MTVDLWPDRCEAHADELSLPTCGGCVTALELSRLYEAANRRR